jgi:hypothetical protein
VLPVKVVISVDLAAGASAPVWAAATVGVTTTVHAPARSTTGTSAPIWVVATTPLGVHGYHCTACSHVAFLASLSSSPVPPSAEIDLVILLPHRASSYATAARTASAATAASTSALATTSSVIASLVAIAAIAVVSTAARSHSCATTTSTSYRCYVLEVTEH